jgi:hypothetical protein
MAVENVQPSAQRQIQQRQGVGSILFGSPLESVKYMLTPGGALYTSFFMKQAGSITVFPSGIGQFFLRPFMTAGATRIGLGPFWAEKVVPGVLGGGTILGGSTSASVVDALATIGDSSRKEFNNVFQKSFRHAVRHKKWMAGGETAVHDVMNTIYDKLSDRFNSRMVNNFMTKLSSASFARTVNTAMYVSRLGSFITPIATGWFVGSAIGRAAELSFKAGMSAIQYAAAKAEQLRSLEFGGTLGAGYRTQSAATERQRAMQALQRNHMGGRRALGTEAQQYAALI